MLERCIHPTTCITPALCLPRSNTCDTYMGHRDGHGGPGVVSVTGAMDDANNRVDIAIQCRQRLRTSGGIEVGGMQGQPSPALGIHGDSSVAHAQQAV